MGILDPQTQGLLSAAFAGLQASGPSRLPTSFGQVIGAAGEAGMQSYGQAQRQETQQQAATSEMALRKLQTEKLQQEIDLKKQQLAGEQNIATVDLAKEMVIHKDDAANAAAQASREHGLATAQHGLAVGQAVHDQNMDVAQHALNVHQAMTPPEPSDSGGS